MPLETTTTTTLGAMPTGAMPTAGYELLTTRQLVNSMKAPEMAPPRTTKLSRC